MTDNKIKRMCVNKQWGLAVLALSGVALLVGCGESQLSQTSVTLSAQPHPEARTSSSFNTNTTEPMPLPQELCYVIHVSGPGLTEIPGDSDVCGPESGQAYMTPRAYKVGETAKIVLNATSSPRVFELLGFASPLGVDAEGKARCGTTALLEYQPAPETDDPRHTSFKLMIDGKKVSGGIVKFYSGEKPFYLPDLTASPFSAGLKAPIHSCRTLRSAYLSFVRTSPMKNPQNV